LKKKFKEEFQNYSKRVQATREKEAASGIEKVCTIRYFILISLVSHSFYRKHCPIHFHFVEEGRCDWTVGSH
jgi:hypothetical protein